MMRPISTPLLMGGFEPEIADFVAGAFRDGFTPIITGAGLPEAEAPTGPLREGDAVGVSLIAGDLEMGATGTVTHIDGDRLRLRSSLLQPRPRRVPDDSRARTRCCRA